MIFSIINKRKGFLKMIKKICFGITLVLAIAMCLGMLFFPILEFDREAIYKSHQTLIDRYVEESTEENKTEEELKEAGINEIIYDTSIALQMYYSATDVVYDEDNGVIGSLNDNESIMFDVYRLKDKGIKYTDLANGVKNQITYDVKLYQVIQGLSLSNAEKRALFFDNWTNPFPFLLLVLLLAFEFACAFLLIFRSVKGIMEKRKTRLMRISIFGAVVSLALLCMPAIFQSNVTEMKNINDYVATFAMIVKGTAICWYAFIGFLVSIGLSVFTKILK